MDKQPIEISSEVLEAARRARDLQILKNAGIRVDEQHNAYPALDSIDGVYHETDSAVMKALKGMKYFHESHKTMVLGNPDQEPVEVHEPMAWYNHYKSE